MFNHWNCSRALPLKKPIIPKSWIMGIYPSANTPLWNKVTCPNWGSMVINHPLIRPYCLGSVPLKFPWFKSLPLGDKILGQVEGTFSFLGGPYHHPPWISSPGVSLELGQLPRDGRCCFFRLGNLSCPCWNTTMAILRSIQSDVPWHAPLPGSHVHQDFFHFEFSKRLGSVGYNTNIFQL